MRAASVRRGSAMVAGGRPQHPPPRPPSATPICSQQRAPRRWLIGPPEDRNHCGIAIISDHALLYLSWLKRGSTWPDPSTRRPSPLSNAPTPSSSAAISTSRPFAASTAHMFSDRKIAARCPRCSARPGQVPTIARLSRFYNKFCLQRDRSTINAKRAADTKLARL